MNAGSVSLNMGKLQALSADLKKYKNYRIHIGVFGGKDLRGNLGHGPSDAALGNAEIGTIQEFGSIKKNIPERSFLRIPLMNYLPDAIKAVGPDAWKRSLMQEGMLKTLGRLAITGRNIVQDSFATRGFGMWAPNAKRTIARKGSDAPLIDGGELRQSVTHRIVKP